MRLLADSLNDLPYVTLSITCSAVFIALDAIILPFALTNGMIMTFLCLNSPLSMLPSPRRYLDLTKTGFSLKRRQPCVNGDWLCQWERVIFDPHRIDTPQPITKNCHTLLRRWPLQLSKLGAYPSTEGIGHG